VQEVQHLVVGVTRRSLAAAFGCPYSTKLLRSAAGYNSSLDRGSLCSELQELHGRTVNQDEGHQNALGGTVRSYEQLLSDESSLEIVNFECDMRNSLDHFGQRALRLESHPLNTERIALVIRAEQPIPLKADLPDLLNVCRDTEVMILPQFSSPPV
jgi:hypothetical protein